MSDAARIARSYILVIMLYVIIIPFAIGRLGPRLDRLLGLGVLLPRPYRFAAGFLLLAYAWLWIAWAQTSLVRRGGGHPNEILGYGLAPLTRRLVVSGPYRYTRNPMAFGLIVYYFAALAFFCGSPSILFCFPLACLFEAWYHRRYEEPGLRERFGEDYERYRERVPLLLPSFTKSIRYG